MLPNEVVHRVGTMEVSACWVVRSHAMLSYSSIGMMHWWAGDRKDTTTFIGHPRTHISIITLSYLQQWLCSRLRARELHPSFDMSMIWMPFVHCPAFGSFGVWARWCWYLTICYSLNRDNAITTTHPMPRTCWMLIQLLIRIVDTTHPPKQRVCAPNPWFCYPV